MTDSMDVGIRLRGTISTDQIRTLLTQFPNLHITSVRLAEYTGLPVGTADEGNSPNI